MCSSIDVEKIVVITASESRGIKMAVIAERENQMVIKSTVIAKTEIEGRNMLSDNGN